MTLRQIWDRLTRDRDPDITFDEFEAELSDWAWREHERQTQSVVGKVKNICDREIEGF